MWDDRFVFVVSALFGVSIWIVLALRHRAIRAGRSPRFATVLAVVIAVLVVAVTGIHGLVAPPISGSRYPDLGTVLAFIIGGVVGSFSARFVWSLFGARFGAKDPLIGVLVLLLLIVVYSLPVYRREWASLLGNLGLSSLTLLRRFDSPFGDFHSASD
jgi:hypothetical protein